MTTAYCELDFFESSIFNTSDIFSGKQSCEIKGFHTEI